MSHLAELKIRIMDIEALDRATRRFKGLSLRRNCKTFQHWIQETACLHRIELEDCGVHIGILPPTNPHRVYPLSWDTYGEGRKLANVIGSQAELLVEAYGAEVAIHEMQQDGWMVSEHRDANGILQLTCTQ